jgi:hypothetical protein
MPIVLGGQAPSRGALVWVTSGGFPYDAATFATRAVLQDKWLHCFGTASVQTLRWKEKFNHQPELSGTKPAAYSAVPDRPEAASRKRATPAH